MKKSFVIAENRLNSLAPKLRPVTSLPEKHFDRLIFNSSLKLDKLKYFTCSGGYFCWGECCFLLLRLRHHQKWLQLASSLAVLGIEDLVRWLSGAASMINLCSLVLDRYVAVVKPLKYVTFVTGHRIVSMIVLS